MNRFYYIDLFKLPLFLHIDQRQKNSTIIGQFLSFMVFIFLIYSFQQSDVFQHKRPIIIDQPKTLPVRPHIEPNSKNFAFAIAVTDANAKAIYDPSAFSINIYYEKLESIENQTGKSVTYLDNKALHLCNESDFPEDRNVFINSGLANFSCMDNSTLNFEGFWDNPVMTYFFAVLSICTNRSDSNITCKTPAEIKKILMGTYFTIYYKDINYDMNDYDSPVKIIYRTDFFFVDLILRKKLTITYKKVEISDDKSWLGNGEIVNDYLKRENSTLDFDTNIDSSSQIAAFVFYPSDQVQIVSRRFQTFGEACANLGGVATFILIIGSAFVKIFNETSVVNKIMNQLYSFQPIETTKKETSKKKNRWKLFKSKKVLRKNSDNCANSVKIFTTKDSLDNNIPSEGKMEIILAGGSNLLKEKSDINRTESPKEERISHRNDSEPEQPNFEKVTKSTRLKRLHSLFDLHRNSKKPKDKFDLGDIKTFKEWADMHQKKQKVTMSIFGFLKLFIVETLHLKMSPKEKMMSEAQKIFAEEIDVITILKKLQDVEKLKRILLNEKQLCLFNFIAKPMIYHNFDSETYTLSTNLQRITSPRTIGSSTTSINDIQESQKILKIYQEFKNSESLEEIDKRLMRLIDKNFETFVDIFKVKKNEKK